MATTLTIRFVEDPDTLATRAAEAGFETFAAFCRSRCGCAVLVRRKLGRPKGARNKTTRARK